MLRLEEWIIEADIASMQDAMDAGILSSEELVEFYLARIVKIDGFLRSILEINPDALEIARSLDQERVTQGRRGLLHGIPILLKDNIDTADRMHTSSGSIALADSYAAADAYVAAQLRKAGAVLLGKTNMTEWAGYMSTDIWAGYSSRGGLVLNPYGPGEVFVGGSSSGSAVAVAANLAAAAIGTETTGSIISPCNQNSLVGLKPTIGLVSRSGIIPISHSQDTAGPMTRTVRDAAILLGALTGVDERDQATLDSERYGHTDYTRFLDADYLRHARIGIPRYYYRELDAARLAIIEDAIAVLKRSGATIIDPVELPCAEVAWDWRVLQYEFKAGINRYLSQLSEEVPVHTLGEVIAYNTQHADLALKYGQDLLIESEGTSGSLTEQDYLDSLRMNHHMAREQGIDYALNRYKLDALLFLGNDDGDDLAARAGYPVLTVPAGYAETGVIAEGGYSTKGPQGISFISTAFSEPMLFKLAYSYEQATQMRVVPKLNQ